MKIRVLYFEGCPNHLPAVELVCDIVAELNVVAEVDEVNVSDPYSVNELCFLGSPTIQVDGIDVEPEARNRTDFAYSCRTYSDGTGLPNRELVVSAIVTAAGSTTTTGPISASSAMGSVFAAVASSACCWLPLLALTTGISAGGVATFLDRWRPWLIGIAIILLGVSFYSVYFRKWRNSCCEAGACVSRRDKLHVFNQVMVWTATVMVVGMILFPLWGPAFISKTPTNTSVQSATSVQQRSIRVEGMTCDMCEIHVVRELGHVSGVLNVDASYEQGLAVITLDATVSHPTSAELAAAIKDAGYTMTGEMP